MRAGGPGENDISYHPDRRINYAEPIRKGDGGGGGKTPVISSVGSSFFLINTLLGFSRFYPGDTILRRWRPPVRRPGTHISAARATRARRTEHCWL